MKNKGMCQHRFKENPMEKAFAKAWEEQNITPYGRENGSGTLDYMMAEKTNFPNGEVTPRDRLVAATVIQWLGSPVGYSFLTEVLSGRYDR